MVLTLEQYIEANTEEYIKTNLLETINPVDFKTKDYYRISYSLMCMELKQKYDYEYIKEVKE
jgi:hypothetical protein